MESVMLWVLVTYFQRNIVQPRANWEDTCLHKGCCCLYRKSNSGSVMRMRGSGGLPALVLVAGWRGSLHCSRVAQLENVTLGSRSLLRCELTALCAACVRVKSLLACKSEHQWVGPRLLLEPWFNWSLLPSRGMDYVLQIRFTPLGKVSTVN